MLLWGCHIGIGKLENERERMVFILCGAAGLRIGEALGLEIDKHISQDFLTISIEQKARHGKVEQRLKTASALRKVDLHPAVAATLKEFVGGRKIGFLFSTRNGSRSVHPTSFAGTFTRR